MSDAAIQKDVESKPVIGNTGRNDYMSQIAASARKERDDELIKNGETPVDTSAVAGNAPDGEGTETPEVDLSQEENLEQGEEKIEPEGGVEEQKEEKPKLVKIKVDGVEREVPEDKILDAGIRALQKESAADKRLEEATRLLRDAKEIVKPKAEEQLPQEWDDATVAYALEHGNEEQKAYAVSLLRGRGNTIQPDKIAQTVTQQVLDTVDFKSASEWFQSEYKDIVSDPNLLQLASISEDRARANGDTRPRRELYKEIGDHLRKWRGGNAPVNAQTMEKKQDKKSAAVVNLPSASVKKETEKTVKPKTTQEVIAEMRKSRGQHS